jgi:hypothetical protein
MAQGKSNALWWVLGIGILVIAVLAVAVPMYLHKYVESNAAETPSISNLRTICTANVSYQFGHPDQGFASSLADLGAAKLIDPALAKGEKNNYRFLYLPRPDNGAKVEHFTVVARPVKREPGSMNSYLVDENCKIRFTREDRAPKPSDPEI